MANNSAVGRRSSVPRVVSWGLFFLAGAFSGYSAHLVFPLRPLLKSTSSSQMKLPEQSEEAKEGPKEARPMAVSENPLQAARFLGSIQGGAKRADRVRAFQQSRAVVTRLRVQTARGAGYDPLEAAAFHGRGIPTQLICGIPVGPLPDDAPGFHPPRPGPSAGFQVVVTDPIAWQPTARRQIAPLNSPASTGGWEWLGPEIIGGRVRALAIHPTDPTWMWAGGAVGGVWRSVNGGVTWSPLLEFPGNVPVSCLVVDPTPPTIPNQPPIVYAGTGEGFLNTDSLPGTGVYRSPDGGQNWKPLPATRGEKFSYINRLAILPNGKTLLAATAQGIFYGGPDDNTWTQGLVVREEGQPPVAMNDEVLDLRLSPGNPKDLIAGGRAGNAWFSRDGGHTWGAANGIPPIPLLSSDDLRGRVELTYAAADPRIVYAVLDNALPDPVADPRYGVVFQSRDGGQTYTKRLMLGHLRGQGWYANCVWAGHPTNSDIVLVGGLDLYLSRNGGLVFNPVSNWENAPGSAHADHHHIVAHPGFGQGDNRILFVAGDGGIYATTNFPVAPSDPACVWQLRNDGLAVTEFWSAAGDPKTDRIIAGTQDTGTLVYTPGQGPRGWADNRLEVEGGPPNGVPSGDGGHCAVDPEASLFYGEGAFLKLHRCDGRGRYKPIHTEIPDAVSGNALFIAPFILDPNDPRILLAGGRSLWRTTNARADEPKFTEVKPLLPPEQEEGARENLISAIAVPKGQPGVVWVGYDHQDKAPANSGAIFRTDDVTVQSPVWTRIGQGKLPTNRFCTRIVIDPHDSKTVYVLYGGPNKDNLWRTRDGGQKWDPVGTAVLPETDALDLAIHPDDSKYLLLGTGKGLFVSNDWGTTWFPPQQGPTNCVVCKLFWLGKRVVVVTRGRGLFRKDLSQATTAASNAATPRLYPLPDKRFYATLADFWAAGVQHQAAAPWTLALQTTRLNTLGTDPDKVKSK